MWRRVLWPLYGFQSVDMPLQKRKHMKTVLPAALCKMTSIVQECLGMGHVFDRDFPDGDSAVINLVLPVKQEI